MDNILNHLWEVINVALSLFAITISIYIFRKQNIKRSLAYIVTETNLLKVSEKIKDNIEIRYGNQLLKSAHLIKLQIINDGNVEIRVDDFDGPLSLIFAKDARIISTQIIEKVPQNLKLVVDSSTPGKITLDPLLLNSGNLISIELMISEWKEGEYTLDGQIKGGNVNKLKTSLIFMQSRVAIAYWLLGIGLLIGLVAGYSLIFSESSLPQITPESCIINPGQVTTLSIDNIDSLGNGNFTILWLVNADEVQNSRSAFYIHKTQKTTDKDVIEAIIYDGGVEKSHLSRTCTIITPIPTFTP